MSSAYSPPSRSLWRSNLTAAGGSVTSALTVAALFHVYQMSGTDVSSFSLWFIVPVGAILAGLAAASGYYVTARLTHALPRRGLVLDCLLIALGAWLTLQVLKYRAAVFEDGQPVRDVLGIWDWFRATTEHMSLNVSFRGSTGTNTGELGAWGYGRRLLEVAGFSLGGLAICGYLEQLPRCKACERFMKTTALTKELAPPRFAEVLAEAGIVLPDLGPRIKAAMGSKTLETVQLQQCACGRCSARLLEVKLHRSGDKEGIVLPRYTTTPEMVASLERAAAAVTRSLEAA